MRHSMPALLAVAALVLLLTPCLASGASRNSVDLQGAWSWDASFRAHGAGQTPSSSGYGLLLTIRSNGGYTLVERDSANAYLRCSGRLQTEATSSPADAGATASFASLRLTGWQPRYDAYTAAMQGRDTLLLYPARPGKGIPDAAVQRFVRAPQATGKAPRIYPYAERPPRLVSAGYDDYEVSPPDSAERLNRLISPFRKTPDRQYSDATRAAYRYRHDQTPSAVIGDFDGDGVLDVAMYGRADSVAEAMCVLDWNRAGKVVVFGRGAVGDGGGAPALLLELVPKGSRVARGDEEAVLSHDAIRAVHADGKSELFAWNGAAFVSDPQ